MLSVVDNVYASVSFLDNSRPISENVESLVREGVTSIELGSSEKFEPGLIECLSRKGGIRFLVHNYFPPPRKQFILNLASDNEEIRGRSLRFARGAIDACVTLGSPFYSVHAGFVSDPVGFDGVDLIFEGENGENAYRRAFGNFVEAVEELNTYAEARGIRFLVENNVCSSRSASSLLLCTAAEFEELFSRLPSQNLGCVLDLAHLNVSAESLRFSREEFVFRMSKWVRVLHVSENNGFHDAHLLLHEKSWPLDVIARPEFHGLPTVLETRTASPEVFRRQIDFVRQRLAA